MFSNCKSLVYLNLDSIEINNKLKNKTDIFNGISDDLKLCANEIKGKIFLDEFNRSLDCEDNCFEKNTKIIVEKKECVESCRSTEYMYEYNNVCYLNCPQNTHKSSTDEYLCENDIECNNYYNSDKSGCFEEILEGYFLKDPLEKILEKCSEECKTCDKIESQNNSNCNSCKNGKFLYFGNCIDLCKHGYYTDEYGNKICKCSSDDKCKNCTKESSELNLCAACNDGFYKKLNDETNQYPYINCYKNPEGYFLELENLIYKPCYERCQECEKEGTEKENNCLKCKNNYRFIDDFENDKNCYEKCDYLYYFDELKEYHCTEDMKCPDEINKLIPEKNRCIDQCKNDNTYMNEYNNICYKDCPQDTTPNNNICIKKVKEETQNSLLNCSAEEFFISKSCGTEVSSPTNKDQLISNIQNDITNRNIDDLLDNITQTKQDLVVEEEDIILQITTTENQINNKYTNLSTVKLGDCEDRLKNIYGINKNLSLIIFKIDYYSPGLLIPIIGYEIYHPEKNLN